MKPPCNPVTNQVCNRLRTKCVTLPPSRPVPTRPVPSRPFLKTRGDVGIASSLSYRARWATDAMRGATA